MTLAGKYPLIAALMSGRKRVLAAIAAGYAALALLVFGWQVLASENLFTPAGTIIGGDFSVFHFAASAEDSEEKAAMYDAERVPQLLRNEYQAESGFLLGWMYPPTMFLLLAPFDLASYPASYALWIAAFGGLFLLTVYRLQADKWQLFFVAASPATFQAVITGQTGFLTASLIACCAFADRRPVLAGVAAGLLTVKPQLGLLIPVAFAAGGCWRAFAAAAATALALALASLAAYGSELWIAFASALSERAALMGGAAFLNGKLVTPFGFATMLGAPAPAASAIQLAAAIGLSVYVALVWRRVRDWDLCLAALATSALLATPYAFYYELVVAAPAMALIAARGARNGFLPFEKQTLMAAWLVPLFTPGAESVPALPASALAAIVPFVIVLRRVAPALGDTSSTITIRKQNKKRSSLLPSAFLKPDNA